MVLTDVCVLCLFKGLIKIRGDKCWRDLTCMDYHYEVCFMLMFIDLHYSNIVNTDDRF